VRIKCFVKTTKTVQLIHNVNNSGTYIPILCSEICQSICSLAIMRLPICGKDGAGSVKR